MLTRSEFSSVEYKNMEGNCEGQGYILLARSEEFGVAAKTKNIYCYDQSAYLQSSKNNKLFSYTVGAEMADSV